MIKTRQWKWTLIALCAILVLVLATLGLSAIFSRQTTALAEDKVLPENTAQYTFTNDADHPWLYDKVENSWESTIQDQDAVKKNTIGCV